MPFAKASRQSFDLWLDNPGLMHGWSSRLWKKFKERMSVPYPTISIHKQLHKIRCSTVPKGKSRLFVAFAGIWAPKYLVDWQGVLRRFVVGPVLLKGLEGSGRRPCCSLTNRLPYLGQPLRTIENVHGSSHQPQRRSRKCLHWSRRLYMLQSISNPFINQSRPAQSR